MKLISIIISMMMLVVISCGPTEDELQQSYDRGKEAGCIECKKQGIAIGKDIGRDKWIGVGIAKGKKMVSDSLYTAGQIVGREIGRREGIDQGKKDQFYFDLVNGIRLKWSAAAIYSLLFLFGSIIFNVLSDLFKEPIVNAITTLIREKRWSVESKFGKKKAIKTEQNKWNSNKNNLLEKNEQIKSDISKTEKNMVTSSEFISKGIPHVKEAEAYKFITKDKARIYHLKKELVKGEKHLQRIAEIETWLELLLDRLSNEPQLNIQDLIDHSIDLDNDIKDYLRYDINDFDPEDNDYSTHSEDDFMFHDKSDFSEN